MTSSDCRKQARESLNGKWKSGVLITLAYFLITFAISLIISLIEEISFLNFLFSIANTVISIPLSFGLIIAFMKLKKGEKVKAFDFLTLGFNNFGRAWKVFGNMLLQLLLPIILLVVAYLVMTFTLPMIMVALLFTVDITSIIAPLVIFIIAALAVLGLSIWFTIKSLLYSLSMPIAFDNPDMTAKDVVLKSKDLMKGNRWKYFVLQLSFIGWIILAALTLGVGLLWLIPYMQIAMLCFYENLSKKETVLTDDSTAE